MLHIRHFTGTIRRGVDSARSPLESERTPSGAAGLRAESGGAPPKCIPGGLKTILADSKRTPADFKVRRGLRAAGRWTVRCGLSHYRIRLRWRTPAERSAAPPRTSTADLNPAESAGLQSPLGVHSESAGFQQSPLTSDFRPSAKFVT